MAEVPEFDNIVNQIYSKVNSLFGGEDPNQLFTMLFPAQPLNYRDFVYDTDSRTSVLTKPEAVAEAEFRLADQLLDPAPIALAPNGKNLSVVYRQLLDSYVPALAPLGPYLSDRAYLNAFLNQPITVGTETTTRMALFDEYMAKYVEQKKEWVKERTDELRKAKSASATAVSPDDQQAAFDDFIDWVSTEAPVAEAAVDAMYGAAVIQGYLHETMTILGFLNSASPAESLERGKQGMRHSERSSVDESMSVYPVQFQPSNWFTAMHPNLNPEDLTLAADAVSGMLSSRRQLLATARTDLARLQMLSVSDATVEQLKDAAETKRKDMDEKMKALTAQYGASTMHLAGQILDMVKPPDQDLSAWVSKGVEDEGGSEKWVKSLVSVEAGAEGAIEAAAPEIGLALALDPDKIKNLVGTAVKDIAETYSKHVEALRASQDYAVALRQQAAAEAGDFKLQIAHAQARVQSLEQEVRDLEGKVSAIYAVNKHQSSGPDLSGAKSVFEDENANRADTLEAINSALAAMSAVDSTGYSPADFGTAYNTAGTKAASAGGPAFTPPTIDWTTALTDDSLLNGGASFNKVQNALLRAAGAALVQTFESGEDAPEPRLIPASRLSSEADSMFTEVVIESEYKTAQENTSAESQSSASSWNVSGWFFSAGGQSESSSARSHADSAMKDSKITIGMRAMKVSFDRGGWFQPSLLEMSNAFQSLTSNRAGLGLQKGTIGAVAGQKVTGNGPVKSYIDLLRDKHEFDVSPPAKATFMLPSYPVAMVVAKDITIRIENTSSASSSDKANASKSAATSGGFLCFSASSSSSSKSSSSSAFTGSRGQYVVIRIPGPQILGYVQQLTPEDKSTQYTPLMDASKGATIEDALKRFNEALAGTLEVGGATGHQPVGAGGDGAATPSAPSPAPPVTANGNG